MALFTHAAIFLALLSLVGCRVGGSAKMESGGGGPPSEIPTSHGPTKPGWAFPMGGIVEPVEVIQCHDDCGLFLACLSLCAKDHVDAAIERCAEKGCSAHKWPCEEPCANYGLWWASSDHERWCDSLRVAAVRLAEGGESGGLLNAKNALAAVCAPIGW